MISHILFFRTGTTRCCVKQKKKKVSGERCLGANNLVKVKKLFNCLGDKCEKIQSVSQPNKLHCLSVPLSILVTVLS